MSHEIDTRTCRMDIVVLGARRLRDNDRILLCLGKEHGRLDTVAAGARKPGSRLHGRLEPFSFLDATLYRRHGSELWNLRDANVSLPSPQPADWRTAIAVQAAAELLVLGGPGEGSEREGYSLALAFRSAIEAAADPTAVLAAFALTWSRTSGFGEPTATESRPHPEPIRKFLERTRSDPPPAWRRYRPRESSRRLILGFVREHIESQIEKTWKGMRMVEKE